MAKQVALLIASSVLLVLGLLTDATIIRTTTTTTTVEEENKSGTCKQIPKSRELSDCIDYVRQAAQPGGENATIFDCCRQITRVEKECVCDSLKKVVRKSQKQGQPGEEDVSRMTRRAQNIPNMCRMGPQGCDWSSVGAGMF